MPYVLRGQDGQVHTETACQQYDPVTGVLLDMEYLADDHPDLIAHRQRVDAAVRSRQPAAPMPNAPKDGGPVILA